MVKTIDRAQPAQALENKSERTDEAAGANNRRRAPHAVIIVENMTVPPDRRVWQQARALKADGWRVSVITPKVGSYRTPKETIEGIDIYRHPLLVEARNVAFYALEYASALAGELFHLLRLGPGDIDVVQICNPPDFLFLPALVAKKLGGAKIVFDHHDLTPELLVQKTGGNFGMLLNLARWAERRTFAAADRVISTNAAFKAIAQEKGGKAANDVTIVYSSPDLDALRPGVPTPSLKNGKDVLLFWVGVMGSQDGVDLLLEAMAALKEMPGGDRFHLLIAGDGPERFAMEVRSHELGVQNDTTFAGFLSGDELANAFATADIGVGSDPKNAFNDCLAMNKVMEYMAYGLPSVMFGLDECRKIAGASAFYAANNNPAALAAGLSNLIESPAMRAAMGAKGKARLMKDYCWQRQKERYLDVYRSLRSGA